MVLIINYIHLNKNKFFYFLLRFWFNFVNNYKSNSKTKLKQQQQRFFNPFNLFEVKVEVLMREALKCCWGLQLVKDEVVADIYFLFNFFPIQIIGYCSIFYIYILYVFVRISQFFIFYLYFWIYAGHFIAMINRLSIIWLTVTKCVSATCFAEGREREYHI